ncbi:MAG: hypothetical protein RR763_05280, partial [Massilia sp.]
MRDTRDEAPFTPPSRPAKDGSPKFGRLLVVLVLALLLSANIRQGWLRWGFAGVFSASAVFFDAYTRITADYLTYSGFISMV